MCVCITNDIDSVNLEESDEQIVEEQEEMHIGVYRAWRRAVNDSRDRNAKRVDWPLLIEAFRRSAYESQRRGLIYVKSNYSDLIIKTSMKHELEARRSSWKEEQEKKIECWT